MRKYWKIGVLIPAAILFDLYGLDIIPFVKWFGDSPWDGITYRFISGMTSILFIFLFCRPALARFRFRVSFPKVLVALGLIAIVDSQGIAGVFSTNFPLWEVGLSLLFVLGIGFGEELFSRGLIYGLIEPISVKWAIAFSSIEFGL